MLALWESSFLGSKKVSFVGRKFLWCPLLGESFNRGSTVLCKMYEHTDTHDGHINNGKMCISNQNLGELVLQRTSPCTVVIESTDIKTRRALPSALMCSYVYLNPLFLKALIVVQVIRIIF